MVTQKDYENCDILELRSRKVNRNVCRALWPVNHEQVKKDLEKEEKKITKHFTEKYNYDFEADHPIDGKYEWVRPETSNLQGRQKRPNCPATRQGGRSTVDQDGGIKKARKPEKRRAKEPIKKPSKAKKSRKI